MCSQLVKYRLLKGVFANDGHTFFRCALHFLPLFGRAATADGADTKNG